MTQISDVVELTINVGEVRLTSAGFGIPLLAVNAESSVFTPRVKSYASIAEVAVDWATTTKAYRMANAIFSQPNSPPIIKMGRVESGDSNLTDALTAIEAEDPSWYCLATESVTDADITLAVAFIESRAKVYAYTSEEEDIIATGSSDICSIFQAATRNRSFGLWHQHAGRDDGGSATSAVAAGGVVTVTDTTLVEVGDTVTVLTSANAEITVGQHTVTATDLGTDFSFVVEGAAIDAGPDAITYFVGYDFPNCAWIGLQLGTNPGSTTWKFKSLSGIVATGLDRLTTSEEAFALGKNCNIYTLLGSTGVGITHEGVMASGRFIDVQRGIDFMEARLSEALATLLLNTPKIPYTDAGMTVIEGTIQQQMNSYIGLGILGPLLNTVDGALFRIIIPKVGDQSTADRSARLVSGIQISAQLAGAVHKVAITLNAQV